ncbi:MAG: nucleoside triphosphate pyrophosphohydrolase [Candidatus Sedimenticola sp. (ex Thyasira tokunagai)]
MPINELIEIMARLRDPQGGCPWDREQTFATIVPYTIEEAYEVADAIERGDMEELRDELGDLLFQVVFYAQMAREQGSFDFSDVVQAINTKMLRRHPHVFADAEVVDTAEQSRAWERLKAEERRKKVEEGEHSQLDGVAQALPALLRAEKLQKRAAKVGFDWPDVAGVVVKVNEELNEITDELEDAGDPVRLREEVGDLLFSCVNLARRLDVDAESALREANGKFEKRFRRMEQVLDSQERKPAAIGMGQMDRLWEQVKREEKQDD